VLIRACQKSVAGPESMSVFVVASMLSKRPTPNVVVTTLFGGVARAARLLRRALELWRGSALADIAHLDDLRIAALEQRIDADLESGRHDGLVAELEPLVREHPLRERLRAQLMLALYRSGRQAEALDVYRQTRQTLVEELGIEPSPSLQELERAILRHDPGLVPDDAADVPAQSAVMIVGDALSPLDALLAIAEPLRRELIIVRLLDEAASLRTATAELAKQRQGLRERGASARVAAYVAGDPGDEAARFAAEHNAELLLVDATSDLEPNRCWFPQAARACWTARETHACS